MKSWIEPFRGDRQKYPYIDDQLIPPLCQNQKGVCLGAKKRCAGGQGWLSCSTTQYGSLHESTETFCDGLDNDCDGSVDEGSVCGTCIAGKAARFVKTLPQSCNSSVDCFADCLHYQGKFYYCRNINGKGWKYTTHQDWLIKCNASSACQKSVCGNQNYFCDGVNWTVGTPPGKNDDFCDGVDNNCDGKVDENCTCQSDCTSDQYCQGPCKRCIHRAGQIYGTCVP